MITFSIVFGHPRAYFIRNWCAITWVSNYSYPVTTLCNWIAVIGHLRCAHVNQVHLVFFGCLSPGFKLIENISDVLRTKTFHIDFFNLVIHAIN